MEMYIKTTKTPEGVHYHVFSGVSPEEIEQILIDRNSYLTAKDFELYNSIPEFIEDNKELIGEMDRAEKSTASYQLKQLRKAFNQFVDTIKKLIL